MRVGLWFPLLHRVGEDSWEEKDRSLRLRRIILLKIGNSSVATLSLGVLFLKFVQPSPHWECRIQKYCRGVLHYQHFVAKP